MRLSCIVLHKWHTFVNVQMINSRSNTHSFAINGFNSERANLCRVSHEHTICACGYIIPYDSTVRRNWLSFNIGCSDNLVFFFIFDTKQSRWTSMCWNFFSKICNISLELQWMSRNSYFLLDQKCHRKKWTTENVIFAVFLR